jgi:hypothetical protein
VSRTFPKYIFSVPLDYCRPKLRNAEATLAGMLQMLRPNFEQLYSCDNNRQHEEMVLLTMTPSIVEALAKLQNLEGATNEEEDPPENNTQAEENNGQAHQGNEKSTNNNRDQSVKAEKPSAEPPLSHPKVGDPISHGQVIDISRDLKARRIQSSSLETLLKGSKVYIPPPPPKAEPVSDIVHVECWNQHHIWTAI